MWIGCLRGWAGTRQKLGLELLLDAGFSLRILEPPSRGSTQLIFHHGERQARDCRSISTSLANAQQPVASYKQKATYQCRSVLRKSTIAGAT